MAQTDAVAFQQPHRHHLRRQQPLAVRRPAPVDAPVMNRRAERRERPLVRLLLHRNDVGV